MIHCSGAKGDITIRHARWIEGRDGDIMQAAGTWRKRIPIIVMILWIYVGSSLLRHAASAAIRYPILGAVTGITEVLVGLSIAAGQVFPFAAGLIFLGTLLSSIPLFHSGSFAFPPDHWRLAVALAGSAALMLSPWIRRMVGRLSVLHRPEYLDGRSESKLGCASREDVQIMIKLDPDFDTLRKPRCSVTIRHLGESARSAAEIHKRDSDRAEHDHKLPFWVR
jgi:uncharacterized membrane protein YphA (DoxX/SURF4 family)